MITAVVLICAIDESKNCYHATHSHILATEEECVALITQHHAENRFTSSINGKMFTLTDYQCINWNANRI